MECVCYRSKFAHGNIIYAERRVVTVSPTMDMDRGVAGLFYWRYAPVLLRFFAIAGAEPDHFVGVNKMVSLTIHAHFWSRSVRESKDGKWGWQNYRNSDKRGCQKWALLVCNIPEPYRIVVSRYEHSVTV
jgi:hypothetical protein